ncbi:MULTISPECIES: hypothetical protein [unclassified Microbacterium]|uniref:hypothetical protein n=1 Tax=unclassified Microbacterium TaxID=2609290 RepID=UPI00214A8DAB|nr:MULTISPECIES: hypothetical protein [unclassified Microbacterium]MCR2799613.1 hypothetical protein [Microbacterium sp. zg.Y818]MCR2827784.1 hypothetical protein [Microbacterium sp. zg.Y909]WIM21605.1 hypothetical protein QNO21_10805 [Microbacterium sp. zg-Y818]
MDTRRPSSLKSPWLIGFGLVAVAQLASVALGLPLSGFVTWLLAPLLAVWVWGEQGPKLLVLVLMFFCAGDILGNPAMIGVGRIGLFLSVAAFAVANVLLIILLVSTRARPTKPTPIGGSLRWRGGVAVLFLIPAAMGLALTWGNLSPVLRLVGSLYLLLLVVTATTAFVVDICTGLGAALLFSSHLLVVLEVGGRIDGTGTVFRLAVLALYTLGILLIAAGIVNQGLRTKPRRHDGTRASRPRRRQEGS